jgi:hypothetical protein
MGTAHPISRESTERSKDFRRRFRENLRLARAMGIVSAPARSCLESLSQEFGFSLKIGDLLMIDGGWYVTHSGLVRLARRKRCQGIHVEPFDSLCDSTASRFVFKAIVYPSKVRRASSATVMPTPRMSRSSFVAPRCAWPRPVR